VKIIKIGIGLFLVYYPYYFTQMMKTLIRLFLLVAVVACSAVTVSAQGDVDAWPEFDIWITLTEKDRLFLMTSFATDEGKSYNEGAVGIGWDRRLTKKWSVRGSYRYVYTQTDPSDTEESRLIFDAKYYIPLGKKWMLTNRNRVDLRFVGSDFSWRFRDRIQIERPTPIWNHDLILWSSLEGWYDSNYNVVVNRTRVMAGFTFFFTKWLSTDIFYAFQDERNPESQKNALGIFVGLWLDASNKNQNSD
jgi:hypothetical protein